MDHRQDAITMHKLTCCHPCTPVMDWYHACMLAIVPTLQMCQIVGTARRMRQQSKAWNAAQDAD